MRRLLLIVFVIMIGVAAPRPSTLHAQGTSSLVNAPLTHLTVVTPDIQTCVKGYAAIFGIPTPTIKKAAFDLPNGKKEEVQIAFVPMPNFYIEILQPMGKNGPIADHLKRFGLGLYALGVGIDANVDGVRQELVGKGGTWTGGKAGGAYAFVDFRDTPIGATIVVGPTARPEMPPAPTAQSGLFGGLAINHVGFANTDAAASVKKIVEVFGMAPVEPRRFPPEGPFPYPPGLWTENGSVQTAMLRQGKIGVEVIQGVGDPNPWSAQIKKQKGICLMHIAVGRGKMGREEWLKLGQELGGKWTNGGPPPTGSFAYLDWTDTLGIVIE